MAYIRTTYLFRCLSKKKQYIFLQFCDQVWCLVMPILIVYIFSIWSILNLEQFWRNTADQFGVISQETFNFYFPALICKKKKRSVEKIVQHETDRNDPQPIKNQPSSRFFLQPFSPQKPNREPINKNNYSNALRQSGQHRATDRRVNFRVTDEKINK